MNVVTREETITDFNKVEVGHAFKIDISQSDTFKVVIRIDDNLLDHLRVVRREETLRIGLKPRLRRIRNATLQAVVTMPELTRLRLSGASHGTVTGFKSAQALDVDLSGASSLQGDIEAGAARFGISGASKVTLTGSARDLTIRASGASKVDLTDLPAADANIDASGASHVTVNPGGMLAVNASGASHVYYLGDPTLGKVQTSGSSFVKRK